MFSRLSLFRWPPGTNGRGKLQFFKPLPSLHYFKQSTLPRVTNIRNLPTKNAIFPIFCTEFWRTLCMYILIFPNYFSCTLTLLLLCCTGGHPVYAGWAGGGRVPVQAGEWEPGPSAQQEERAGRQLGRYTQGPQLTSATGHIPRWDTANVAFRSEIWIVSVWVLSIFLSTKTLSTYQGCWSESAFIYFPGSGSAFNMWIRIQEEKIEK